MVGTALGTGLSLARVVVLTRILEISIYGQLTILVLAAGFVTMFCRATLVTGTIRSVFRGGDDEEGGEEEVPADEEERPTPTAEQKRALGTGLVACLLLTALLTIGAAAFAEPIDRALIDSGSGSAVAFATAMGGLGAAFYLVSALARFERRPAMFVSLQFVHGVLGLGAGILAIEAGYGLDGAIGGLAVGSLLSFVPAVLASRHRFALSADPALVGSLFRLGLPLMGITIGFWLFRNADLFMVSRYLSDSDVAVYQVAARVGMFASALVGGLIMAWGPLMRGPLRGALHREGRLEDASARVLTYFWFLTLWLVVSLFLLQDELVKIAPTPYGNAAPLIPLLGLSALATSLLLMVYRTSRMRNKRSWFVGFSLTMPILLVALSIPLISALGLYGAATAGIAAPGLGAAGYLTLSQCGDKALQLPWRRLLLAALLAAATAGVVLPAGEAVGSLGPLVRVVGLVLYPALLAVTGIVPRRELRALIALARKPAAARDTNSLTVLTPQQLSMAALLLRDRRGARYVAQELGRGEEAVLRDLVAALRQASGLGSAKPVDAEIGRYLTEGDNVNLSDREGHLLSMDRSLDALEVDRLADTAKSISKMRRRRWLELVREAGQRT